MWDWMKSEVCNRKVDTWEALLIRILDATSFMKNREDQRRRKIRDLRIQVAKFTEADGGVLEQSLWIVTNFSFKDNKFIIYILN
jgi:hypothetical protein